MLTCEEEYRDRFDDYAEDEEPKNRDEYEDDDNWLCDCITEEEFKRRRKEWSK